MPKSELFYANPLSDSVCDLLFGNPEFYKRNFEPYLEMKDLKTMALVNKKMLDLTSHHKLWLSKIPESLSPPGLNIIDYNEKPKELYLNARKFQASNKVVDLFLRDCIKLYTDYPIVKKGIIKGYITISSRNEYQESLFELSKYYITEANYIQNVKNVCLDPFVQLMIESGALSFTDLMNLDPRNLNILKNIPIIKEYFLSLNEDRTELKNFTTEFVHIFKDRDANFFKINTLMNLDFIQQEIKNKKISILEVLSCKLSKKSFERITDLENYENTKIVEILKECEKESSVLFQLLHRDIKILSPSSQKFQIDGNSRQKK